MSTKQNEMAMVFLAYSYFGDLGDKTESELIYATSRRAYNDL